MNKKLFLIEKISNNIVYIGKSQSNHLINVLKIKKNDIIYVTDGIGNIWKCLISNIIKNKIQILKIKKYNSNQKKYKINLYVSPIKSFNRFKWLLEKSVEIGVDEITPLLSNNCENKFLKIDRAINIINASVKQSLRSYIPIFNTPLKYEKLINKNINGIKYIGHCNKKFERNLLKNVINKNINNIYNILIGPEGDFTFEEIKLAIDSGWIGVKLSEYRLKTETAAIVFLSAISLFKDE